MISSACLFDGYLIQGGIPRLPALLVRLDSPDYEQFTGVALI